MSGPGADPRAARGPSRGGQAGLFRPPPPEARAFAANALAVWLLCAALAALALASLPLARLRLGAEGAVDLDVLLGAILMPLGLFYTFARFDAALASIFNGFAALMLMVPALCLLTYEGTALGGGLPLRDALLARADAALGFSWPAMLGWAEAHPRLADLGRLAYASVFEQAAATVVALTLARQAERLQVAVYAFAVGALLSAAGAGLVPALGAYAFHRLDPSMHPHVALITRDRSVAEILALRDGTFGAFSLGHADGIVSFPSFHTALAVLFAWACWRVPLLRWPVLALDFAMVAATPLQGSHHLVDVLAGAAVGGLSIALARRLHGAVAALSLGSGAGPALEPATTT